MIGLLARYGIGYGSGGAKFIREGVQKIVKLNPTFFG